MSKYIESLEGRQLFCSTATSSSTPSASPALVSAVVITPNIFTPSQVEGRYKGTANVTVAGTPTVIPVTATIASTSVKLVVTGFGSFKVALTAKQFKRLRDGHFNITLTINNASSNLTGDVTSAGKKIAGTINIGSGPSGVTGTFSLKKV